MGGADLGLMLAALRARFGLFALVLGVTVLATAAISLLLPKTYVASVSLVLDTRDEQQSMNTTSNPLMQPRETIAYMQTQMDIINSERVARKVSQSLKLAQNAEVREDFEKARRSESDSIEDWLAEALLEKVKVETTQSSVLRISYPARDPVFAAAVANAFAQAYIASSLELRVEPTRQAATWFEEQLKSLRASLERAQIKLTDYLREHGIVAADERSDVETTRLAELSAQLVKIQDQTYDLQSREAQARGFLERERTLQRLPEVISNPFIQKLKSDLAAAEARLREMGQQYGTGYPAYQRQLEEVKGLRARVDSESHEILGSMASATQQSRARESELRRALAEQRARLLQIKEGRNDLTVLTRDVESAQRAYDTAMQRSVVSQVESRASQSNITLLSPAVAPRKAAKPKVMLNIALSFVVGLVLGAAIVVLMELLDRRVRSRRDLESGLAVPLLGVIEAWRAPGGAALSLPSGGPAGRLPAPG